jgi:4-hydroxythreonine-4-phosphate dehydrogenase
MYTPTIAITAGEPAGIGPDICALIASKAFNANLVIIADQQLLAARAKQLGLHMVMRPFDTNATQKHNGDGTITVLHTPLAAPSKPGELNAANGQYVLNTLSTAAYGCIDKTFDGVVTAPVHKGIINDAGISFTGHTEFFANLTETPKVVMMLVGGDMRVALVTTHLPLKAVPAAITKENVESTIRILHHDLTHQFGIDNPRILVAGLNPHAGEDGHLGMEEIEIINPVLAKLRQSGMDLSDALPADTLFAQHHLAKADAVLAMYHDQGLPVLKHASFGSGVNVTLGLPILRTSVDHGTALDLAGNGNIEIGSMVAAIELAILLANKKSNH